MRQLVLERQDLVDLLLVLDDDHRDLGMFQHVDELGGDRVLIHRHRDAAEALRGKLRPIEPRTVVADHREVLAALEAGRRKTERQGAHFVEILRPGHALPDGAMLLADRWAVAQGCGVATQQPRQRGVVAHAASPCRPLPAPRYARITSGLLCTCCGVPSAMLRPLSSTATRCEMSITTPMSCSIRMMVVPHSELMSRMKRAISSFSSWFMPPIGSSSSSSFGSSASARPSSTRLRKP